MAFDATADEQSTWQLEPFFWSAGASLTKVDTPAFQSALQLWVNMVKDGSASKSVLNWGQDPDLTQQFMQGHAAMIVDGPWIFPELNQKGWTYNKEYGIVPIPTDKAGQTVIAPLGGETIDLGNSGSDEQKKLARQDRVRRNHPELIKDLGITKFQPVDSIPKRDCGGVRDQQQRNR